MFFLTLGILESYKTKEIPVDTLAFVIALIILLVAAYLTEKYLLLKKIIDKNPKHFDSPLWLLVPAIMSLITVTECCIRETERPITAIITYFLVIAFWENIISAIDKWLPTEIEVPVKIALAPLLIPVVFLQIIGVMQKEYYKPYFKESNLK